MSDNVNLNEISHELDWDGTIQHDSTFTLLPAGEYDFEIISIERARHPGSAKLPPCNKAILSVKLTGPNGFTVINHNLLLHTKTEGILCEFFTAIGHRKHGEPLKMNWEKVVGAVGRCKVNVRKYNNDKGEEREINQIQSFYEPKETPAYSWRMSSPYPSEAKNYQKGLF